MTDALTVQTEPMSLDRVAQAFHKSGYFEDTKSEAQAIVKILAGRELGFGPMTSMMGIHIIKGKPAFSAHILAAAVKRSGKYNYRIREHDANACVIEFFENGEAVGTSAFTLDDAKAAGILGSNGNWQKYPKHMLFARAMSSGFRWFCADLCGAPVYTPEELGAAVDGETGDVLASADAGRAADVERKVLRIDRDTGEVRGGDPDPPHPDAEAVMDGSQQARRNGVPAWRIHGLTCYERRAKGDKRYFQAFAACEVHDAPWLLPDGGEAGEWCHGSPEGVCYLRDVDASIMRDAAIDVSDTPLDPDDPTVLAGMGVRP